MPADPAIGHRIERRRQVLGMTQEELARRVGVNRASIGNWESGRHFPKRYLGKLEEVLGIQLDPPPEPSRIVPPELRKMVRETLEDPADQRRVLGLLEGTLTWPAAEEGEAHRNAAG
jgi:transcriptional regulator with XRE-family HTH domain